MRRRPGCGTGTWATPLSPSTNLTAPSRTPASTKDRWALCASTWDIFTVWRALQALLLQTDRNADTWPAEGSLTHLMTIQTLQVPWFWLKITLFGFNSLKCSRNRVKTLHIPVSPATRGKPPLSVSLFKPLKLGKFVLASTWQSIRAVTVSVQSQFDFSTCPQWASRFQIAALSSPAAVPEDCWASNKSLLREAAHPLCSLAFPIRDTGAAACCVIDISSVTW